MQLPAIISVIFAGLLAITAVGVGYIVFRLARFYVRIGQRRAKAAINTKKD